MSWRYTRANVYVSGYRTTSIELCKAPGVFFSPKRHTYEAVQFMVVRECCFATVGFCDVGLPIVTFSTQSGEHCRLPDGVNIRIQSRHWVQVTFSDGVQFSEIYARA